MTLPLERFRMLDLTRLVPGPMATWMLAGVEKKGSGIFSRTCRSSTAQRLGGKWALMSNFL